MGEITPDEARGDQDPGRADPALRRRSPSRSTPGTKWVYCQSGINTAARIVEVVSGEPFDEFLEQRLFGPLGMKDTTFYLTEEQLPRLAKSYRRTDEGELEATAVLHPRRQVPDEPRPLPGGERRALLHGRRITRASAR